MNLSTEIEEFLIKEAIASYDVDFCPKCRLFHTVTLMISEDDTGYYYCCRCKSIWAEEPVGLG